ncbi:NAD-dependent dehydratase [Pseudomonas palleroniana]|uniref:NAD dependent epimerase/dehydratase family protein n=1 Tax=Pseudomonas palleroniana TaxID=191390 RepID=A0A1H5G9T4_9PSED|nr:MULTISPECIES: SDR family oxidoreductase [Pseudomonas]KAB0565142.1 SDR family oxidoreductase [Pseudomonas palleroniana]MBM9488066.1 SDR family oxidoreductase [Pseudomonas sp. ICBG1301]PTC31811.1 NAD-dependent dehydratase [Pseudomonas palleroniana]SEE12493.1 NAD dependent epimerase/dehydratase family protein [Pseudomonas palleroniana]
MHVLITGASGFVGSRLVEVLKKKDGVKVTGAVRRQAVEHQNGIKQINVGELSPVTDWAEALAGVDVVIHAAARVHVMNDAESDPLAVFRKVNVEGTLNLARQAVANGVGRFIFISSIKVNGEATVPGKPFTAEDIPAPLDPYGVSKMEAEAGLRDIAANSRMEVVIIRPVLVYGPGVKANFLNMMRWLDKGVPLPFGSIFNRRSLVALDNLVDLVITTTTHPAAANQTFLVSDGEDLSTTQLLRRMATALNKKALLLPIPSAFLSTGASLLGKKSLSQRLCGSLQVDISKTCSLLSWRPPVTVDHALGLAASYYLETKN